MVFIIAEKRFTFVLEIIRKFEYVKFIKAHQFVEQENMQRTAFEKRCAFNFIVGICKSYMDIF